MAEVMSVDVASVAKILGAIYALFGLIIGFFITIFSFLGAVVAGGAAGTLGVIFGIGAIIFIPLFYGIMGLIVGAIMALVYNFVAKKFGGIKMELKLN